MVIGGEALFGETVGWWRRRAPGIRLINEYGPTETVVGCCVYEVGEPDPARGPVPIGRPIANTRIYLLDPGLQPVPRGVPGGLYVGGCGVARGYLGRPDLTAEKFVPDPFAGVPGERLYRTGDLARLLATDVLEYLGRDDHQVKVRGFRVEPGEIEAVLGSHPAVREAAVLARDDAAGGMRLVGYVAVDRSAAPAVDDLRRFLAEKLPAHLVPAALVVLESLPLTANGKVDRKALSQRGPAAGEVFPGAFAAPRTPVEELLAEIFAAVLQVERVAVDADFFEIGGHSLLATQVISRVRESLAVELPLRHLFAQPTVAGLAEEIEILRREQPALGPPCITPAPRRGKLPLSFAQQRLWSIEQLEPWNSVYNTYLPLRLSGRLEIAALRRALDEVLRRHEVLRTSFAADGGEPFQRIHDHLALPLPFVDLQELPRQRREGEMQRLALAEAQRPFDLARAPLLRGTLLCLAEGEHALLFTLHHIVSDGWSMGILVREVAALYGAFTRGEPSPLPELPIQYADFAHWQRSWLAGEVLEGHLAFWKRCLEGAPHVLELPADYPRPEVPSHCGEMQFFELPPDLSSAVRELCRREGVTLFMALLAALDALLYLYSGQTDIVIGAPIANRRLLQTEGLIGFFVNTLPLRVRLAGGMRFRELLRQVREQVLDASAHQDLPFEKLVEELRPDRHLGRHPLYQVVLTLQNTPAPTCDPLDLTLTPFVAHNGTAKFDLTVNAWETPQGLAAWIEHSSDLFAAATIRRMWRHFERLLGGVVAGTDARLDGLEIFSEEENLLFAREVGVGELESEFWL
jgi:hypothetical protein